MIVFIMTILFAQEAGDQKAKEFTYSKAPKSLFLIKKAQIDSNVGEPSLHFIQNQKRDIANDERLVYKP